jgi:hypothetical protein
VLVTVTVALPFEVVMPPTLPSNVTRPPAPALATKGFAANSVGDIPTGRNASDVSGSKIVSPPTA